MLIAQGGGNNASNEFYLPNFLRVKSNYSTTHYSTPTPMNGKSSKWTGIESNES